MSTISDKINSRRLKDVSKEMYIGCIHRHLDGVDLSDPKGVFDHLSTKTVPTRIMALKAAFHVTLDKQYNEYAIKESESYKSSLMKRHHKVIDWEPIIKRTYARRNFSMEEFTAFLLSIVLHTHPRRFSDYYYLSTKDEKNTNYYDGESIHFRVFKTERSITAGQRVVKLEPKIRDWFNVFIKRFETDGWFFTINPRQFRYIFEKHDLPCPTVSRRDGERADIAAGMSHVDASQKYNHSIATQAVSYLSHQAVPSPPQQIEREPNGDN